MTDKKLEHAAKVSIGWIGLKSITETLAAISKKCGDKDKNGIVAILMNASEQLGDVMMDLLGSLTREELEIVEELQEEYSFTQEVLDALDPEDIVGFGLDFDTGKFNSGDILDDILGGIS